MEDAYSVLKYTFLKKKALLFGDEYVRTHRLECSLCAFMTINVT